MRTHSAIQHPVVESPYQSLTFERNGFVRNANFTDLHDLSSTASDLEVWLVLDKEPRRTSKDIDLDVLSSHCLQTSVGNSSNVVKATVNIVSDQCLEVALSWRQPTTSRTPRWDDLLLKIITIS